MKYPLKTAPPVPLMELQYANIPETSVSHCALLEEVKTKWVNRKSESLHNNLKGPHTGPNQQRAHCRIVLGEMTWVLVNFIQFFTAGLIARRFKVDYVITSSFYLHREKKYIIMYSFISIYLFALL